MNVNRQDVNSLTSLVRVYTSYPYLHSAPTFWSSPFKSKWLLLSTP